MAIDLQGIGESILGRLGFSSTDVNALPDDDALTLNGIVSDHRLTQVGLQYHDYSVTRVEKDEWQRVVRTACIGGCRDKSDRCLYLIRRYSPNAVTGNEYNVYLKARFPQDRPARLPSQLAIFDLSVKARVGAFSLTPRITDGMGNNIVFVGFTVGEKPTFTTSGILKGPIDVTPLRRSASGRLFFEARGKPLAYLLRAEHENLWFKIWVPTRPRSLKEAVIRAGTTLGIGHFKIPTALQGLTVFTRAAIAEASIVALYVGLSTIINNT